MKHLRDKVAVVTGAGSGIGRGLAERCAREGMKVVLADVEQEALAEVEAQLRAAGAEAIAMPTDVSKAEDVERLARRTLDAFGAVHVLFNNAGVGASQVLWESSLADWQWILGVNLWGVIHGIHTFVPLMLRQGDDCHIVNTASIVGLISSPGQGAYKASKHAIVTLTETLHHELAQRGANIHVSLLCPAWVNTRILDAERNRPKQFANPADAPVDLETELEIDFLRQSIETGLSPEEVAEHVFRAIREERFYILTHPEWRSAIQTRMEDILQQRNPSPLGDIPLP